MVEKEDLGLSLCLRFSENGSSLQLNLISSSSSSSAPFNPSKTSRNDNFPSSDREWETCSRGETRSFLKGVDVNRLPSTADGEDEAGVSSPISTVSSGSGKRSEREANGDENENERSCSRGISDEEDGDTSRKKLRPSKDQSVILEESFEEHSTLNPKQKLALAKRLGLSPRQVEVWFQNRRARTKLKQTEVACELLKRCCENLTEENRRLHKEAQELRALKFSPQLYAQITPPTTLTMCPSCEHVARAPSLAPTAPVDHPWPHPTTGATTHHHHHHHHHRPIPFNPWASGPTPNPHHHRPIPFNP